MTSGQAKPLQKVIRVLIVDDDENDILLIRGALDRNDMQFWTHSERSGDAALEYLRQSVYGGDDIDVVLLDLRMPGRNGHETLRAIRSDPELSSLPVVIVTTSDQPDDMQMAFQNRAQCFVTKPATLAEYDRLVDHVLRFWNSLQGSDPSTT